MTNSVPQMTLLKQNLKWCRHKNHICMKMSMMSMSLIISEMMETKKIIRLLSKYFTLVKTNLLFVLHSQE